MDKIEYAFPHGKIPINIENPQGFIKLDNLAMYQVTLRDYFAAKAMAALISLGTDKYTFSDVADSSYDMADAMLEARKK